MSTQVFGEVQNVSGTYEIELRASCGSTQIEILAPAESATEAIEAFTEVVKEIIQNVSA